MPRLICDPEVITVQVRKQEFLSTTGLRQRAPRRKNSAHKLPIKHDLTGKRAWIAQRF